MLSILNTVPDYILYLVLVVTVNVSPSIIHVHYYNSLSGLHSFYCIGVHEHYSVTDNHTKIIVVVY